MKAVRIILKWMIISMLSFTTFNLFISSEYEFDRSIEIESPIDSVYNQLSDLHNWPNWAVWWKNDSTIVTEYFREKSGKGASMKWKGEEVGVGGLKIVDCNKEEIEIKLNLGDMTPSGFFKFEEINGGTKVTWRMKGEMPFFIRFMTLFMDKMAGPDLEEGLKRLKDVCEGVK
ncbi:MAG: SRPBCC family protein [Flavobacteriales bacterium]|nr:SRPBCC family protein [Flavobacteriales bacterium]